jgi:hypothetical protein
LNLSFFLSFIPICLFDFLLAPLSTVKDGFSSDGLKSSGEKPSPSKENQSTDEGLLQIVEVLENMLKSKILILINGEQITSNNNNSTCLGNIIRAKYESESTLQQWHIPYYQSEEENEFIKLVNEVKFQSTLRSTSERKCQEKLNSIATKIGAINTCLQSDGSFHRARASGLISNVYPLSARNPPHMDCRWLSSMEREA